MSIWSKSTCPTKNYLPENCHFSYFSKKSYIVDTRYKHLSEALLMATYNIRFFLFFLAKHGGNSHKQVNFTLLYFLEILHYLQVLQLEVFFGKQIVNLYPDNSSTQLILGYPGIHPSPNTHTFMKMLP